ncbi:reverse transcriptase [Corchorus capsularis]|uniref:Reverse transcriptase n=1 Tax=Corchorus capsularis TaxID=210143 RepID=A0A1R3K1G6_COCAP|nr:reverse transcriptase [Corchorus capsularis]
METQRERSGEEEDLLARSTKKIKSAKVNFVEDFDHVMDENQDDFGSIPSDAFESDGGANDNGDGGDKCNSMANANLDAEVRSPRQTESTAPSFRDMVRGDSRAKTFDEEDIFGVLTENEGLIEVSTVDSWPALRTSPKMKQFLHFKWRNCLIVKLLGRNIGYKTLQTRVTNMWKPRGHLELIDLGEGFFVAKFSLEEDLQFALAEGPWVIFGHYLTVRRWRPDFRPSEAVINSTAAWIRFPELPTEYFDERFLLALGNTIGRAIKVDKTTHFAFRGKFARVCVEIDLNKKLVPNVMVDDRWTRVEYEGLPLFCFHCGYIEHRDCSDFKAQIVETNSKGDAETHANAIEVNGGTHSNQVEEQGVGAVGSRFAALANIPEQDSVIPITKDGDGLGLGATTHQSTHMAWKVRGTSGGKSGHVPKNKNQDKENMMSRETRMVEGIDGSTIQGNKAIELGHEESSSFSTRPIRNWETSTEVVDVDALDCGDMIIDGQMRLGNSMVDGTKNAFKHPSSMKSSDYRNRDPPNSDNLSFVPETQHLDGDFRIADPIGFSGGLWICWEAQHVSLEILYTSTQVIHAIVRVPGETEWLLSAVYASPLLTVRKKLWDQMEEFALVVRLPWMMLGDFNDISNSSEKFGGATTSIDRCLRFNTMVTNCGLLDLGFQGPTYTWTNRRQGRHRIHERLDRALSNVEWRLRFPEAIVKHLPRFYSDHCPILVQYTGIDLVKLNVGCPTLATEQFQPLDAPITLEELVRDAFDNGCFPEELNETLLVFIPKVQHPEYLKQFRPISLCCVAYKVITKVLVNRIRPHLGDLIAPTQVSFIPGRQAADNILLAQELIYTIRRCSSKNGLMAVKIDLAKAYDRVNWSFLRDTLREFGFSDKWIRLIMFCVESSKMAVLWNGEKLDSFLPQRGLRQGDPPSPYLFVLCMERLGHLIDREVRTGAWKPIKAGRNCPGISYLFFVDDLFLFSRADPSQATVIKHVLDEFCMASGAKISLEKSKLFVSPKARGSGRDMSSLLGITGSDNLGKYLGVPLIHGRVTKATFKEIIEKVQSMLSSWKSRFLSLAGRATLISSVTTSIPAYNMMTMALPKNVTRSLDSLNNRFLWGGNEQKRGVHLVSWEDVCRPKRMGGLGLRRMELHNIALLQKTAWRFITEEDSLWVKFIKAKYRVRDDVFNFIRNRQGTSASWSYTWKGIMKALTYLEHGLKWRIGNGSLVRFWTDPWLLNEPILQVIDSYSQVNDTEVFVRDYRHTEGGWDSDKLFQELPLDLALKILGYPIPRLLEVKDRRIWKYTANGVFNTQSAYLASIDEEVDDAHSGWKWFWRLPALARWLHFLWLVRRGRLLTNSLRASWGLGDALCRLCGVTEKSIMHTLRDCTHAYKVWVALGKMPDNESFFEWVDANLLFTELHGDVEWRVIFIVTLWRLWTRRCDFVMKNGEIGLEEGALVALILHSAGEVMQNLVRETRLRETFETCGSLGAMVSS